MVCPSCQHIYSFSAIEKFFGDCSNNESHQKSLELFLHAKPKVPFFSPDAIDENAVPTNKLQNGELTAICEHLGIQNISAAAFDDLHMLCSISEKRLYFPMQDAVGAFAGYKILSRGTNGNPVEETVPPSNSFGVVVAPPSASSKRLAKDHTKPAIVVLNMLDVLAIRSQKINGLFILAINQKIVNPTI